MSDQFEFDLKLLDPRKQPPDFIFAIQSPSGQVMAQMNLDGSMTFHHPPDEAAKIFWQSIERAATAIIERTSRQPTTYL